MNLHRTAWAALIATATGAAWFDTWFWISIREPHAFSGRDAGGGLIIAVGMLLAGLGVALVSWAGAAWVARRLDSRAVWAATILAPLVAVGIGVGFSG